MLGLVLALIYVGWKFAFTQMPIEESFLGAAWFLYHWYWAWTWVLALLVAVACLVFVAVGSAQGEKGGGVAGAIFGAILGGGASLLVIVWFVATRALLIIGSYLLMNSGETGMSLS